MDFKNYLNKHKIYILLICILLLASILRFWNLGKIPSGSTPDEATYIYSAYSIFFTQKDLSSAFLPLSFNLYNSFSPVPVYIMAPFVGFLKISLFSARLPFVIAGILDVLLIYLFTAKITQNKKIALLASFVLSVSAWHIQFSRISYDGALALFFYLLGSYLFISLKNLKGIILSTFFLLLGFYSYHATKIFFLFLIPLLLYYEWPDIKKRRRELFFFITGSLFILLSFLYVLTIQHVSRQKIVIGNNNSQISSAVNLERTYNTAPLFVKNILSNKLFTYNKLILGNYLGAFSSEYLFINGEMGNNAKIFGITNRGALYLIDLPFLVLGLLYFLKKKERVRNFVLISLLIAPTPSAITIDASYGLRSIMMLPFLAIIVGAGIYYFLELLKNKGSFKYPIFFLVLVLYLFSVLLYVYQYQFRYSIYGAEAWNRSSRDLVEYIASVKNNYSQVYIADSGGLLTQYGIFNKLNPREAQTFYKQELPRRLGNISFIGSCISSQGTFFVSSQNFPPNTLYAFPNGCYKKVVGHKVKSIVDVGEPLHTVWDLYSN
ncbi:hypothetical protein M1146_01410 [Patescibacteria group bacterium]|nr:hypothetical protein [Patescibacteria group bacterium]